MMRKLCALAAAAGILTAVPLAHSGHGDDDRFGVGSFRPVATFSVPGATSAEIVSATRDGKYLVYSDAIGRKFGLVDIRNPRQPQQVAVLDALGDPTSVAVVAIENEGALGKGYVEVVRLNLADFANSPTATVRFDDESALRRCGTRRGQRSPTRVRQHPWHEGRGHPPGE